MYKTPPGSPASRSDLDSGYSDRSRTPSPRRTPSPPRTPLHWSSKLVDLIHQLFSERVLFPFPKFMSDTLEYNGAHLGTPKVDDAILLRAATGSEHGSLREKFYKITVAYEPVFDKIKYSALHDYQIMLDALTVATQLQTAFRGRNYVLLGDVHVKLQKFFNFLEPILGFGHCARGAPWLHQYYANFLFMEKSLFYLPLLRSAADVKQDTIRPFDEYKVHLSEIKEQFLREEVSATRIQACYRGYYTRKPLPDFPVTASHWSMQLKSLISMFLRDGQVFPKQHFIYETVLKYKFSELQTLHRKLRDKEISVLSYDTSKLDEGGLRDYSEGNEKLNRNVSLLKREPARCQPVPIDMIKLPSAPAPRILESSLCDINLFCMIFEGGNCQGENRFLLQTYAGRLINEIFMKIDADTLPINDRELVSLYQRMCQAYQTSVFVSRNWINYRSLIESDEEDEIEMGVVALDLTQVGYLGKYTERVGELGKGEVLLEFMTKIRAFLNKQRDMTRSPTTTQGMIAVAQILKEINQTRERLKRDRENHRWFNPVT